MRETHLPLMSRGGWIFLKQHLAWQITLEKQTFAKAAEATHTSWDEINSEGASKFSCTCNEKQAPKGFRPLSAMEGIEYFQD